MYSEFRIFQASSYRVKFGHFDYMRDAKWVNIFERRDRLQFIERYFTTMSDTIDLRQVLQVYVNNNKSLDVFRQYNLRRVYDYQKHPIAPKSSKAKLLARAETA